MLTKAKQFYFTTHCTEHLSQNEFVDQIADAIPGAAIIYARGDLAFSGKPSVTGDNAELLAVKKMAMTRYLDGRGYLTQRRLTHLPFGGGTGASFEYIFTVAE